MNMFIIENCKSAKISKINGPIAREHWLNEEINEIVSK